jgi:uncharacterized protein (TIGR02145 family)
LIILVLIFTFLSCSKSGNSEKSESIEDIDGNTYATIDIFNQVWLNSNLNVSRYRNGDPIPQVTDPTLWANLTTGAWCYYNNDPANGSIYGKLYNWYAVNDSRGLAPIGWHVPTDNEWTVLTTFLGGSFIAGGKMKAVTLWNSPNTAATNSSGFTALPGGSFYSGFSFPFGVIGGWWSSSEEEDLPLVAAWNRQLRYNEGVAVKSGSYKTLGISVRCMKN